MAGDITLLPLLVGLGATSMSVGVHLVPIIRYAIRNLDYGQCREMAGKALCAPNSRTIVNLSLALARESYPGPVRIKPEHGRETVLSRIRQKTWPGRHAVLTDSRVTCVILLSAFSP